MKDFEKKLALKLKGEAERIVPKCEKFNMQIMKITQEENEHFKVDLKKRGFISRKKMIASAAVIILIFISIFSIDNRLQTEESGYTFQIIAFAGSENMDRNQMDEKLLEADISMVMPNGQITLNPEADMQDSTWAYDWGTASFYVTGKDVERVTYALKNGTIIHYDQAMEYKQNIEGNPVQIEFFLSYTALNLNESQIAEDLLEEKCTERFEELWNSGKCPELEAVKTGYFAGKSLDIEKYTMMNFVGTWKDAQTGGRYFRLRDIELDTQLNKEAHKVTVEYYDFDYGKDFNFGDSIYSVTWNPMFKPYSTIGITNPADLPGDQLTITIELQNGEIIKKVILLSFDEKGYVLAEIKE